MSEYSLEKSYRSVGPIYPVLVDKDGNVIDGFHRRQVDGNWPTQVLNWVKTREDQLLARIVANTCRRTVDKEERRKELTELAVLMANRGVPRGKIASEIAEKTGLSEDYVRSLLPKSLKLEARAEAATARWEAEKRISEEKAPFAERSEILHRSSMQILPPLAEGGEILPPPTPDLGRVELREQKVLAEQEVLTSFYPEEILNFVVLRIGQVLADANKAVDAEFVRKAARRLLALLWSRVSGDRFLMEALEEDFGNELRKL